MAGKAKWLRGWDECLHPFHEGQPRVLEGHFSTYQWTLDVMRTTKKLPSVFFKEGDREYLTRAASFYVDGQTFGNMSLLEVFMSPSFWTLLSELIC